MTRGWRSRGARAVAGCALFASLVAACSVPVESTADDAPPTATPVVDGGETVATPTPPATVSVPTASPTTEVPAPTRTPSPTATLPPTETPAPTATPQPEGPCGVGPLALPDPQRPVYRATLDVDPATASVTGRASIEFTPDLDIEEVVVRLWANSPRPRDLGADLRVQGVAVNGQTADFELEAPTLGRIELESPVTAGSTINIDLSFALSLPGPGKTRVSSGPDAGGAVEWMRLGSIIPLLPWQPGIGWGEEPETAVFGEAVVSPVADWQVEIIVPEGFDVLASGSRQPEGTWVLDAGRDFAVSVGRFRTFSATAMAPEPVEITVGVHDTLGVDGQAFADKVVRSLEQFSGRWGQYPWPTFSLAITPDLGGGIEFPTHVMQGPDTLGRTTSHEIGHMFFYSLVGNNQATDPWLDEGLASYAEFTFEDTAPGSWAIPEVGVGRATEPMTFWEIRSGDYYRSVYSQTGWALMGLGPQEQVDCALARFVADNAHRIATGADLVAAFEPAFPDVVTRLAAQGVEIDLG